MRNLTPSTECSSHSPEEKYRLETTSTSSVAAIAAGAASPPFRCVLSVIVMV